MRRVALCFLAALSLGCASLPGLAEPTVVRVVMADDWASAPLVGEVIEDFERAHDVRVVVQGTPFSQIPDQVAEAIDLGQPPDLAHWHAFAAAAAGLAEPIDDQWEQAGLRDADFLPGAVEDVEWDGARYGVPLDVNALVLMANTELLQDAGIDGEQLRTLSGFREAAAVLRSDTEAQHAIAVSASSWAAYGWIVAAGGSLIEDVDDGVPSFTFDDAATVEAIALLVDLVDSGDAPPPLAPDLALDAISSFATGESALHASGSWDLPTTRRALQADSFVAEVSVMPLPQADPDEPQTVLGGSSLFVPRGADEPDLAFELMLALTEPEVGRELAAEEGRLPARADAYDDALFRATPDLEAFVEQLPTARVMPLIAYPEVAAAFRDGLEAALSQRRSPAEAMASVQEFADRWVQQRSAQES